MRSQEASHWLPSHHAVPTFFLSKTYTRTLYSGARDAYICFSKSMKTGKKIVFLLFSAFPVKENIVKNFKTIYHIPVQFSSVQIEPGA